MDGQRDGTDVCPLRGDERRMCSLPLEIKSVLLTELEWEIQTGSKTRIWEGSGGSKQLVKLNSMWLDTQGKGNFLMGFLIKNLKK